ncbi:hypothetical protein GR212_27055 [Rhizobium lusitanum]|uniref:Uncharacterized protein n=1 Tax=Rhizobium lusitanum TaxID=293958 RepID=A0A6L9UF57_9HYPH|nr:hypothetical protein [Rhizobium lusitanum]NEI73218.1 hypothetical protein [Rhizobium lusitanum]
MPKQKNSRAVQSFLNEREEQREQAPESELDKGLRDTFPASDPVSATHTTASSMSISSEEAKKGEAHHHVDTFEDKLPIATPGEVLKNVKLLNKNAAKNGTPALYGAATQILRSDPAATSRGGTSSLSDEGGLLSEIKQRIRERPIAIMVTAIAIGFAWGMTR